MFAFFRLFWENIDPCLALLGGAEHELPVVVEAEAVAVQEAGHPLTNERRVLRVLTNERLVLRVLTNKRPVLTCRANSSCNSPAFFT